MKKYLIIGLVVALIIGIFLLASCNPTKKGSDKKNGGDGKITLTYWRTFDSKESIDPIISDYERDHSNINIEYKKLDYAEYQKTVVDALAAGKGPDMFSVQNTWMPLFFDKTTPIAEDQMSLNDYEKSFFPVAVTDNVKDKRVYGIPYSIDTLALYYNTAILDSTDISGPPKTWEELVGKDGDPNNPGMLGKLNNRPGANFNQSAIALGNATVNRAPDVLALMMLQQKTDMVSEAKDKALFNLTQDAGGKPVHLGTNALNFYTSFANPRSTNYSWNSALGDSVQAFAQGKVEFMINYAYQIPTIERLNPNLKYDVAPVPQIAGQDPVNYASYWTEVVSKTSSHQKEAWEFIKYVSSKGVLSSYNQSTKTVSSRKEGSSGPGGKYNVFYEQSPTAQDWYKGDYAKADQIFIDMITQVIAGEDPQRAIDAAANRETDVLTQLKSQPG